MDSAESLAARLRENPEDHQAYQALKSLYRRSGDAASLANLIAGWAGWVADDVAASEAFREVGDLLAGPLADVQRAEEYYLEALRRDPRNLGALDALEAMHVAAGDPQRAWQVRDEHTQSLSDLRAAPQTVALALSGTARLVSEHLRRPDEALQLYRSALDHDAGLVEAAYGARQILLAQGDLRAAAELYEREIASEPDATRRLGLLTELSALFRDDLDDLDSAVSALERAHGLSPEDATLQYELASLLLARAERTDERTAHSDRTRAADLLCSIASGLPAAEAIAYLESALSCAPEHEGAMAGLERHLEGSSEEARLALHWVAHLAAAQPSRANDRRRVKLARAYLAAGQKEDAIFCLQQADPSFAPAAELLAELKGELPAHRRTTAPPPPRPPRVSSAPAPAYDPSPVQLEALDADDAHTVVGAPDLLDSLRDESASRSEPAPARGGAYPGAHSTRPAPPPADDLLQDVLGGDVDSIEPPAAEEPPLDLQEARQLRRSAASLAQAQRHDEAAEIYERLLASDPLDREAFAFLDSHYRRRQQHDRRAQLLEQNGLLEVLPKATRASRLREAAAIYEARLKNAARAARAMQLWVELEPESEEAQRGLRRLLERAERWQDLAQLTEADYQASQSADQRISLLRRLLVLYRDKLGDRPSTASALERLLDLRPDDRNTRDALLELLPTLGRHADCVQLLEDKIRDAPKPQKLTLLHDLARLYRDALSDAGQAFTTYERIAELAPGDIDALEQMARLDHQGGNMQRLLATLDRQVSRLDGDKGAALLARMADIAHAELGDTIQAVSLLSRAVELAPERSEHVDALCALYEATQQHSELVELLRERVVVERNANARIELLRRIAHVEQGELDDPEAAFQTWSELLKHREDQEALLALRARAEQHGDLDALVGILGRLAVLTPDVVERRDLLLMRSDLLATRLGRPADAIADLVRVLSEIDPSCDPALERLWQASEAAGDFRGLIRVLELRLSQAHDAAGQLDLARKLSDLYARTSTDVEAPLRAHAHWIAADPRDPEPHRRNRPLLAKARRESELLSTLDALSQLEPDQDARDRVTIDAATLSAKRKDVDGALERLTPLVERRVPEATDAFVSIAHASGRDAQLYDVLERAGDVDRLLALLRERVGREKDKRVAASLLRRVAQLLVDYKQDEQGAAEAYVKLLTLEEDIDALRFLQAHATRRDDPQALSDVLARLSVLEKNPVERRALDFERARLLHTRLKRAPEAVRLLVMLTEEDADLEMAWEELLRACETAEDPRTLAVTLERLLGRTEDVSRRIELARRMADVCEQQLKDATRTLAALTAWAEADPDDPLPQRRRRPLLGNLGRNKELLGCLDALARTEPDPSAQLEVTLAAAALCRNALDDKQGAWRRLLPLCSQANTHVDQALYTLADEVGRHDELYAALESARRYETLVDWLEQRTVHAQNPGLRVDLLRRMARILAGPLDDQRAAEQAFERLLALREDQEALAFVRAYALQHDDVERLADALKRLAAIEQDPTEKRDLAYEHGHLLRTRLNRPKDAVTVLQHVLAELDPEFEPALDDLIEAARAADDANMLAWALERALALEPDAERRIELARRLAKLCTQELRDPSRAAAALGKWAEAAPTDPTPHERILELLDEAKDPTAVIGQLDAIVEKTSDAAQRLAATLRAARIAFEHLKNGDAAWARLEPLINAGSAEAEALASTVAFATGRADRLVALYEAAERYDDLIAVLRQQAERAQVDAERADLFRRCARLLAGPLGDELAAAEAYRETLRFAEDAEALEYLRDLCTRTDAPEELAHLLGRLEKLAQTPAERRDLAVERAMLLSDRLERPEDAIKELRRVLVELDPDCRPAFEELIALCETHEDWPGLALGLERQLVNAASAEVAIDTAGRLASVYEDRLDDPPRAITALQAWVRVAPRDPQPLQRLRPLLQDAKLWSDLLAVLDGLSALETSEDARLEALLAAADLATDQLGDASGALERLSRRVLAFDADAEEKARAVAERGQLLRALANLYVLRAQQPGSSRAGADWRSAAELLERCHQPKEALEALLRALALDMQDAAVLDAIDRLAVATSAWDRLERVYARLIQGASVARQVELLRRHAELLEKPGKDPAGALERLLAACKLAPTDTALLDHAEGLAAMLGAHAELEWIAERRQRFASTDEDKARLLIRQARIADLGMKDREQALRNLTEALALTADLPHVAIEIENLARELDKSRPEAGKQDALRGLVRAHLELSQTTPEPFGPKLVLRAAQLLQEALHDEPAGFDALKQGANAFPQDLALYDALERAALRTKRLDALDAHLARAVLRVDDPEQKRGLLRRRGHLLGEHLQRHAKAAEVYRELLALDPHDEEARKALPPMLRKAGRFQELLKLFDGWLGEEIGSEARVALLREKARLWEVDLRNRPGAQDVWRELLSLAPDDAEAQNALSRMSVPPPARPA